MRESELAELMNHYLYSNCMAHANEVRMGIGIPDIVVGSKISNSHNNIFDYYILKIFFSITDNELSSFREVEELTRLPRNILKKYIQQLTDTGFITSNNGSFEVSQTIEKDLPANISIELKVKDWRSGLLQAQRYLHFSDYSYVALPENNIDLVDSDLFESVGIGLISVSPSSIHEVIAPLKSNNCDLLLKYISISYIHQKCSIPEGGSRNSCSLFSCLC